MAESKINSQKPLKIKELLNETVSDGCIDSGIKFNEGIPVSFYSNRNGWDFVFIQKTNTYSDRWAIHGFDGGGNTQITGTVSGTVYYIPL